MANPTSNFGWQMPTNTDLVKDLPADFEVFGQAVDTSLMDLKGGTTGQVLSKASNTDMDFTWVTSDDANAIQNTIVDAKGDLISASAADVPARLAVGNNGEQLLADSSATTGLRWQETISVNACINGGMDIWQRGTSFSIGTSTTTYTADRFLSYRSSAVVGMTVARSTDAPTGFTYSAKVQRDSGNTGTQNLNFRQAFESQQSKQFAGKTVVVSFYAKAGANYSPSTSNLTATLVSGTGTDESAINMGSWTGLASTGNTVSLTTSWVRYSFTASIASTSNQLGVTFACTPVGTAGADDSYFITGIQVEVGSVATPFRRSGVTLGGELAACQRYFVQLVDGNTQMIANASAYSASEVDAIITLPVPMRTYPSLVQTSGTDYFAFVRNGGTDNFNSLTISATTWASGSTNINVYNLTEIASTAGHGGFIRSNNASARLAASAEL